MFEQSIKEQSPSSSNKGFFEAAGSSFMYSLLQAPIDSINQMSRHTDGEEMLPGVHLAAPPQPQKDGSAGSYGQMLGGFAGTLPYFFALTKLGTSTAASYCRVAAGEALPVTARMGAAAGTGVAFDLLFVPLSAEQERKNFWLEKGKTALTSGLTFAAMDGATFKCQQWFGPAKNASKLDTAYGAQITRNGASHLIGGAVGGIVTTEAHSLLSGKGLTTEGLGTNVAMFSFLGLGSVALDSALLLNRARLDRSRIARVDQADMAVAPETKQTSTQTTRAEVSSKVEPPKSEPSESRQSEKRSEISQLKNRSEPLEVSPLKNEPVSLIEKLVTLIKDNFSSRTISLDAFKKVLESIPEEHRVLAQKFLEQSATFTSSVGLREHLRKISNVLKQIDPDRSAVFITSSAASEGNYLAYFLRKALGQERRIMTVDDLRHVLESGGDAPKRIIFLDDWSKTMVDPYEKYLMEMIPEKFSIELASMQKSINFSDMAGSPEQLKQKLLSLIAEANEFQAKNGRGLGLDQIVDCVLSNGGTLVAKEADAQLYSFNVAPQSSKTIEQLYERLAPQKTNNDEIARFLNNYQPEKLSVLGKFLARGAEYIQLGSLPERSLKLYKEIIAAAKSWDVPPEKLLFLTNADPGGSSHMIAYILRAFNKIPEKQFVTSRQLAEMSKRGELADKVIVLPDDTVYSGSNLESAVEMNAYTLDQARGIVSASFGIMPKGVQRVNFLAQNHKIKAAYTEVFQPLFAETNPFYRSLDEPERALLREIIEELGYAGTQSTVAWTHMVPDNSVGVFKRFAMDVLHLPYTQ